MKKYLIITALTLFPCVAHADGISCPEMAQIIADYEHKKQAGHLTHNEGLSIPSVLAADYQSYYSGGCTEAQLKNAMRPGEKFKTKAEVR